MELEWEQGRQPAHTAAALAGAFLGAALGADWRGAFGREE